MDNSDNSSGNIPPVAELHSPVGREESGQKLLRFLERRLGLPEALLHRWVRTGQIRLNGGRCKPFDRVREGDMVRLPPFAATLATETAREDETPILSQGDDTAVRQPMTNQDRLRKAKLELLDSQDGIWALNKPAGLPVQSGTGQPDSIAARLHVAWKDCFFQPVPAHRLDRDTSGVLLVGADFESLRSLQEAFRDGGLHKEYLVWVAGAWPCKDPVLLRDWIRKEKEGGVTRMCLRTEGLPFAKEALCLVKPLHAQKDRSLLQVRLLTGRTHQIRAQLAGVGFPALGDGIYGRGGDDLKLHSLRIVMPDSHEFNCLPPWQDSFRIDSLPDPIYAEHGNNEEWQKILPRFCEYVTRSSV